MNVFKSKNVTRLKIFHNKREPVINICTVLYPFMFIVIFRNQRVFSFTFFFAFKLMKSFIEIKPTLLYLKHYSRSIKFDPYHGLATYSTNGKFLTRNSSSTGWKILQNTLTEKHEKKFKSSVNFGIVFDVDGVLIRGNQVLSATQEAFNKLIDSKGKFIIPLVFLTNSGTALCNQRAEQLTKWLGVKVEDSQVIMSYSPLKTFHEFHNKHILFCGQGPVKEIARKLGFQNVILMDQLCEAYPTLDIIDINKRASIKVQNETVSNAFPLLDALVIFCEPIFWETHLQILMDLLLTNGKPSFLPPGLPDSQLPIIACNTDLLWMAEACIPRFGNGAFLCTLEALYKKITGLDLIYTALLGKPACLTYQYTEKLLIKQADKLHLPAPKTIYAIGDNINTDILGANLYNEYLHKNKKHKKMVSDKMEGDANNFVANAQNCYSILVETGVGQSDFLGSIKHCHRDYVNVNSDLLVPAYTVHDVCDAVELIYEIEYGKKI